MAPLNSHHKPQMCALIDIPWPLALISLQIEKIASLVTALIFFKTISKFQRANPDSPSRTWAVEATTATFVMLSNARACVRFPGKEKFPILSLLLLLLPLHSLTRSLTFPFWQLMRRFLVGITRRGVLLRVGETTLHICILPGHVSHCSGSLSM